MDETVDLCHDPDEEGCDAAALRIRMSRRQLRPEEHSQPGARGSAGETDRRGIWQRRQINSRGPQAASVVKNRLLIVAAVWLGAVTCVFPQSGGSGATSPATAPSLAHQGLITTYCTSCHNERLKTAG